MIVRLAGFGGQGIVLAGYVLGRAGLLDGHTALQTQSYGSEARGGTCKSDVTISDQEILELTPGMLDALVVLSQPAADKYLPNLNRDGLLLYDSDLVRPGQTRAQQYGLPATETANKAFGRGIVANMIMLGALAALTGIVSPAALRQAVTESVPPQAVELNLRALEWGLQRGGAPPSSTRGPREDERSADR